MKTLSEALATFVEECNGNARLREMNRDWSRRVQLAPDDSDDSHFVISDEGKLSFGVGVVDNPDMIIQASEEILTGIFSGKITPTEPYNAGDLLVRGHQDDMMRLDIITLLIWGE